MFTAHGPEEKITDRDLRRVMAARRALREYAPYEPPPAKRRVTGAPPGVVGPGPTSRSAAATNDA